MTSGWTRRGRILADVAGVPLEQVTVIEGTPVTRNDPELARRLNAVMAQALGAEAVQMGTAFLACDESGIGRAYRDARIQTIYGGTTEIMKTIVAKDLGI